MLWGRVAPFPLWLPMSHWLDALSTRSLLVIFRRAFRPDHLPLPYAVLRTSYGVCRSFCWPMLCTECPLGALLFPSHIDTNSTVSSKRGCKRAPRTFVVRWAKEIWRIAAHCRIDLFARRCLFPEDTRKKRDVWPSYGISCGLLHKDGPKQSIDFPSEMELPRPGQTWPDPATPKLLVSFSSVKAPAKLNWFGVRAHLQSFCRGVFGRTKKLCYRPNSDTAACRSARTRTRPEGAA